MHECTCVCHSVHSLWVVFFFLVMCCVSPSVSTCCTLSLPHSFFSQKWTSAAVAELGETGGTGSAGICNLLHFPNMTHLKSWIFCLPTAPSSFIAIHHSLYPSPCQPQPPLFSFNVCCGLARSIVQDKHAQTYTHARWLYAGKITNVTPKTQIKRTNLGATAVIRGELTVGMSGWNCFSLIFETITSCYCLKAGQE